jgi:hypothetical protein
MVNTYVKNKSLIEFEKMISENKLLENLEKISGIAKILHNELVESVKSHISYIPEYFNENEVFNITGEHSFFNSEINRECDFFKELILFQYREELPNNQFERLNTVEKLTGNEIVLPFCNKELFDLALELPFEFSVKNKKNKHIIYEIFKDEISGNIFNNKKRGFQIPLMEWLKEKDLNFIKTFILEYKSLLKLDDNFINNLFENSSRLNAEKIWILFSILISLKNN